MTLYVCGKLAKWVQQINFSKIDVLLSLLCQVCIKWCQLDILFSKIVFVYMIFFPFFEECLQVMSVYLIAMGERGLLTVQ